MPIKINSTGGGSVSIDVPSTGGTYTLTAPANNATIFTTAGGAITGNVAFTSNNVSIGGQTISPAVGMRNRIINGDMRIDQRFAGASANTGSSGGAYTLDRWGTYVTGGGVFSIQQSSTIPTGFINSQVITVTSSDSSISAGDVYQVRTTIEGLNCSDLAWGTASAKTVTLSFWVRSSLTGTFSSSIRNYAGDRSYVATYTISSANTWEYKTITIPGDTTGTWLTTNSGFCFITWSMGCGSTWESTEGSWLAGNYVATTGSVDLISTLGATFYLTGVQLEEGSVATPFERRLYGQELALCQRYFQKSYDIATAVGTATRTGYVNWNWGNMMSNATVYLTWPVRMRASPTVVNYNPDLTSTVGGRYWNGSSEVAFTGSLGGWASYQSGAIFSMDATSRSNMLFHWTADAEL